MPLKSKLPLAVVILISLVGWLINGQQPMAPQQASDPVAITKETDPTPANDNAPRLSERRRIHILYGDESGGGHYHATNKPCKSEFPESWDEQRIIQTVKTMAANDNVNWRQEDNGYYVSEQTQDGIRVRIVLDGEADDIVTAYPVNVPRNACDH